MPDSSTTVADLRRTVEEFVDQRNWRQFHTPKNLAMALAIETAELMELIIKLRDTGLTIFLVEHDMRLVMGISELVTVLDYGQKIAEGTPKEIQQNETVIDAYLGTGAKTSK